MRGMLYVFILFDSRPTALYHCYGDFFIEGHLNSFYINIHKKGHPQKIYHWLVNADGFRSHGVAWFTLCCAALSS